MSGQAEPETVHNVMMLPRNQRRHDDGVSDNNVDMTSPLLTRWRVRRWRVGQWRQLINTREQAWLLEHQSCDVTSCPWWARRLECRIRLRATVTWHDALDVMNVNKLWMSVVTWPSWLRASTVASIPVQIQINMETQSRPIPAKMFYFDELALVLYCRQPASLTWSLTWSLI
jgi:hypothetical protein